MKLKKYRVQNFKNILNSGDIDVEDNITCLVGKNESGKTALLKALCNTNPADSTGTQFNYQDDYPKKLTPAENDARDVVVVECCYELEDADVQEVKKILGEGVLTGRYLSVKTYYDNRKEFLPDDLKADRQAALNNLADKTKLPADKKEKLKSTQDWSEFINTLSSEDRTDKIQGVIDLVTQVNAHGHLSDPLMQYILNEIISPLIPKFFYLDEYPQLKGSENIDTLFSRGSTENPRNPDGLLASFLEMAELDYHKMANVSNTVLLENIYGGDDKISDKNKRLSKEIFKHWTQNKHLQIKIDPKIGGAGEREGMQTGVNIWIKIYDRTKNERTLLERRSRGFIWFFSILVQYALIKRTHKNVILLLDEPGLHLHGKAQEGLLKHFDEEFSDTHIIYTTHSPFMVDVSRFDRILTVHDTGSNGAKVSNDALSIKSDSLLPPQAALGYGVAQSLFISPNCLIVEGVSDMLFLKAVSSELIGEKRTGLSPKWTIIPAAGIGKVQTFVSIITSREDVNAVVLLDAQKQQRQTIDNLHEQHLLEKEHVLTYADFLSDDQKEADVEDLFERSFYIDLVNETCKEDLSTSIKMSDINNSIPRVVVSIEEYLKQNPMQCGETKYDHYKPARYFYQSIDTLWKKLPEQTKSTFEKMFEHINQLLK